MVVGSTQEELTELRSAQPLRERRPRSSNVMKSALAFLLIIVAELAVAQVQYLTNQHMDFRLQYDLAAEGSNQLDLVLGYDPGQRVASTNAYIVAIPEAMLTIPANPNFAFLGPAGSPVWILPQSQNTSLPYLGISAEDIPNKTFADPMEMELLSVEGPGNFFAWAVSGAGQPPSIKYIATNGVVSHDHRLAFPFIGSHEHNNWAFSTNGLYRVTLRANGRFPNDTTNTVGRSVSWAFQILPLRPWENWITTNWLPATASNISGPAADPDGDSIPNVIEYALGLDPNAATATGMPKFLMVEFNGESYGALSFTRVKAATDLEYLSCATSDLTSDAWATLTDVVSVADNGDTETVVVRDSAPLPANASRFFRLSVRLHYP